MRKDYKDRVPGTLRRSRRRRRNAWIWAIPALLIGVAAIAVFKFAGKEESSAETATQTAQPIGEEKVATESAGSKAPATAAKEKKPPSDAKKKKTGSAEKVPVVDLPEPRFTFYKILPEKEVIVSESEIQIRKLDEKQGKSEAAASYLIQAGSFRTREEAEKVKGRLAAAKVGAKMEQVTIENASWYRVKIGPYKSLMDAEKMRSYLRKHKIDSVLQQTKP